MELFHFVPNNMTQMCYDIDKQRWNKLPVSDSSSIWAVFSGEITITVSESIIPWERGTICLKMCT